MPTNRLISSVALAAAVITGVALGVAPSFAATLQTANNDGAGNQVWSAVGLEFTVNSPISITSLGIFDTGPGGSITGPLTVDLMTTGGVIEASSIFSNTSGSTVNGGYLFQSITPVTLSAGNYYLMGYGWTTANQEHNSNNGGNPDTFNTAGGLVSFVMSVFTDSPTAPPGTLPGPTYLGYGSVLGNDLFSGANIQFSAVATPLPSTWIMLLSGFVGLGFFAYRGTKKNTASLAAA
jgi:hypothetical protein